MFKLAKERRSFLFFALTLLFWLVVFLSIWPNMLVYEPDGLYAGWIGIFGDWAAHMSYASSLAIQDKFPPEFPILAGHVLSYPFGVDYLSALLVKFGTPLREAMLIPSFIFSLIFVVSLFKFFEIFTKNAKTASIATFLFLFNGGLGFVWFIKDLQQQGWSILHFLPREYTHLTEEANIEWVNIITSELIPQRGFLLGLPLAMLNFTLFWKLYTAPEKVKLWQLIAAGLLTGLLPLIHMHTLSVTLGFFLWTFFLTCRKRIFNQWLCFILPATTLAFLLIKIFYPQLGENFIFFKPGWLAPDRGDNLLFFWIKNAGTMLFLFLPGLAVAKKQSFLWSVPFWGLFILANIFIFQPFVWDNTKYFTYWWVGVSLFAALFLEKLLSGRLIFKTLALLLFFTAIFSGALDVLRVTQYDHQKIHMFDNQSLRFAQWVKKNTPKEAVFLTAGNHDHPVPVLTGRSIVHGFSAWLWTYGLDTTKTRLAVEAIYNGSLNTPDFVRGLNVDYIVIGPWEKYIFKQLDPSFIQQNYKSVYQEDGIEVWKVNPEYF